MQFQPKLLINKEIVPSVISLTYLGRCFNFEIDGKDHKVQIQSCLLDMSMEIAYTMQFNNDNVISIQL